MSSHTLASPPAPVRPAGAVATAAATVLRGISQVFLQNSVLAAIVIVLGLAVSSPRLALLALLGSAVQSALASLEGHTGPARDGLMGYNGALVGAAASLDLPHVHAAILATIIGAAACVPVHQAFARLFASRPLARFELPVATAPFCVVTGLLHLVVRELSIPGHLETSDEPFRATWAGMLNAFAEVFLADGWVSGAVVLVALFAASWRVGLWSTFGAALAIGLGWVVGADLDSLSTGLVGYSAVLVAIALGCTFRDRLHLPARIIAVVAGVVLTFAFRALLMATPVPVYTWPFLLAMWLVLAVTARRGPHAS